MNLTTTIRLNPTLEQRDAILVRMQRFNDGANWLSGVAFAEKVWAWLPLQRRAYRELRETFGMRAAEACVCVRKVAYAYRNKDRRTTLAVFRDLGGVGIYKHRYKADGTVHFYGFQVAFVGRPSIAISSRKEGRLIWTGEKFVIHQPIEVAEIGEREVSDWLGVDMGLVNIAVDSDRQVYPIGTFTRGQLRGLRKRHLRLRAKLQKKGTKSAKRLLKKRRRRDSHFARHVNHVVAREIVGKAQHTGRGIALENLKGIRNSRLKVSRAMRGELGSWAFGQSRTFIEYKAKLVGVSVVAVNPRNTSRTCPQCGLIDKKNRKAQAVFKCVGCGFKDHADFIAAENIRRAVGNQPYAAAMSASCESAFSSG